MAIGPPEGASFLPSLTLLVFFIIKSSEINAHRRRVNVWINGQQTKRNFSIFIQAGDFRRSNNVELPGPEHGSSCIMYSGNSAINTHQHLGDPWDSAAGGQERGIHKRLCRVGHEERGNSVPSVQLCLSATNRTRCWILCPCRACAGRSLLLGFGEPAMQGNLPCAVVWVRREPSLSRDPRGV